MSVSFKGIGENVVTFKTSTAVAGKPVTMSANDTVAVSAKDDLFCGVCISVEDGYAAVQTSGYVELPYTGTTAPSVGYCTLVADGTSGVVVDEDGRALLVINVDTTAKKVGFMM